MSETIQSTSTADLTQNEATKAENITKLTELVSTGKKLLLLGNAEDAVDSLSEAARLSNAVYGDFAPESFVAYYNYGRALSEWGSDLNCVVKVNTKDEANSSDEEDEGANENGDGDAKADDDGKKEAVAEVTAEDKTEALDETLGANEETQNYDELTDISNNAWDVLEIAREICVRTLCDQKEESEIKTWNLRLAATLYCLSDVLILDDHFILAREESKKGMELRKEFNASVRELCDSYYQLGRICTYLQEFAEAAKWYQAAVTGLKNLANELEGGKAQLEEQEREKRESEIEDLRAICQSLKQSVNDALESEKAMKAYIEQRKNELKSVLASNANGSTSVEINDISNLVRKRTRPDDNMETDHGNDAETEAKKSKESN